MGDRTPFIKKFAHFVRRILYGEITLTDAQYKKTIQT